MAKTAKNLFIDSKLMERAEAMSRKQGTNVSALVSDLLDAAMRQLRDEEHGPIVRRLMGAGVSEKGKAAADVADYQRYLDRKYGK